MVAQEDFYPSDSYSVPAMAAFMRRPDIYQSASDALAPAPEQMGFEEHLVNPHTWTLGAMFRGEIIGYVQFIQRTSIGGEIHTGFHPQCRGRIAKAFIQYAIAQAWATKGFLKLWALIPGDNRPALVLARTIGFHEEGRLTKAICRAERSYGRGPHRRTYAAGLQDIVILTVEKPRS